MISSSAKPTLAVICPAFNEEDIVEASVAELVEYLEQLSGTYDWTLYLVNDGSSDATPAIVSRLAANSPRIVATDHEVNLGLCQALKTGFDLASESDLVVTMDIDLSYSPDHIGRMLSRLRDTNAHLVLASPYMQGGQVTNVPANRLFASRIANRFLRVVAPDNISTFTGMVRAFDGEFLRSLDLKAKGMDINPEIVYKATLLRARIEEIPAHLHWRDGLEEVSGTGTGTSSRKSSMQMPWHTLAILFSGFVFRPFLLFFVPGALILLFSLWVVAWIIIHVFQAFAPLDSDTWILERFSIAVGQAYELAPHTFLVGGMTTIIGIQLLSLGAASMQNKRYFEELYHLGTTIYRELRKNE